jgi:hypothetical protein
MGFIDDAKDLLRSDPPNIPYTHWESLVHYMALNENYKREKIALVNQNSAEMVVDPMSGDVTITLLLDTTIEHVNSVLRALDIPTTGWKIKE